MKKLALLIGFMTLLASGTAFAVPKTMSFTGRLTTSTGPVTGSVNLTFKLFNVPNGGSAAWTEVRNVIGADNGLVFLDLGEVTPLNPTDFAGPKMYLEIQVGTETLAPRLAINSVPLALHSEDSDTLGGLITAANVVTTVNGSSGIAATKTGNTVAVSIAAGGITAAMIGADQVGMDEVNIPNGAGSTPCAAGVISYCWLTTSFIPATSGSCFVSAQGEMSEATTTPPAGTYGFIQPILHNNGTGSNSFIGNGVYMSDTKSSFSSNYSGNSTYIVSVTAGTSYSFGCYVARGGGLTDNSASCYVAYMCF